MSAEATRNTRMAIVKEVTEGTAVVPSSASQYVAVQDGFSLEPNFDTLESAEFTGSIGKAKPILGGESPTASLSHYLRHSGVEGQEPNYGLLLEMAFGSKVAAGTQRSTTSGSTAGTASAAAVLKVPSGHGASFERGKAVLIKDGTNGYKIRPVLSVSGDDLTLAFNLGSAPASGVALGRAILYKPADTLPSASIWGYRANGGALELIRGAKCNEASFSAAAREFLNGSFAFDGIAYHFDPVVITTANNKLDVTDDGGTFAATIPSGVYKDPHDFAQAVEDALNAAGSDVFTVQYLDASGKFKITSDGTTLSLLWQSGSNTANTVGSTMGFVVSADDTGAGGATGYTSDNALTISSPHTPAFDSESPLAVKNHEVLLGGFNDYASFSCQQLTMRVGNEKTDIPDVTAESGKSGTVTSGREVTVEIVATLQKYEADKFRRFRENEKTSFAYNFGVKSGGNWVPGKCGCFYIPTGTISAFSLGDGDGLVTLNMTLTAFVESGLGEAYLNLL